MFLRKQKEVETKPYSNPAHRGIPSDLCECNFSNDRERKLANLWGPVERGNWDVWLHKEGNK